MKKKSLTGCGPRFTKDTSDRRSAATQVSWNPKRIVKLMNMNMHASWVKGAALASLIAATASAQVVVYDNTTTPLNEYFSSTTDFPADEFGDQISIGFGWRAYEFTFEYFAQNLSGGEKAVLRFFANDGLSAGPGTLIFESSEIPLINGNYPVTVTDLVGLNIDLPPSFTWTVQATGVTSGETFGLNFYDPPVAGSSFDDFWVRNGDVWSLRQHDALPPGAGSNFGAVLVAVPEPGALTLLGIGALALLARRRRVQA